MGRGPDFGANPASSEAVRRAAGSEELSGDMLCAVRDYAESVQGSLSSAYQNEVYVS